ncbi:MAG: biopolymer transporter ExbD [Burkholderiaceae bacterium]|nr:biopolymer transporter ExbD [Burkholderiaceae bacterium]
MSVIISRGRARRAMNEINMVPFIDVMLVLLIIFMVTAPLMTPGVIDVPRAGQSSKPPEQRVEVRIDAAGNLSLSGQISRNEATESQVVDAVKQALAVQPDLPVMIAADSQLRYQQVVRMVELMHEAGVKRVGLAVK